MAIDLDYQQAAADLERLFELAQADFAAKNIPTTAAAILAARLFTYAKTQNLQTDTQS